MTSVSGETIPGVLLNVVEENEMPTEGGSGQQFVRCGSGLGSGSGDAVGLAVPHVLVYVTGG